MIKSFILFLSSLLLLVNGEGLVSIAPGGPKLIRFDEIPESRVINGNAANAGSFPYQAAIIVDMLSSEVYGFCGGSLVSSTVVVTAAHCVAQSNFFQVRLGTLEALNPDSANYYSQNTTNKVVHPGYNKDQGFLNDIALLKLSTPVPFSSYIQPILLPRRSDASYTDTTTNQWKRGDVSGWGAGGTGLPLSTVLRSSSVPPIANPWCEQIYGVSKFNAATKICIWSDYGTAGACEGDSGGPFALITGNNEKVLWGIVSYGPSTGCSSEYPEAYTRVTAFLDWIASNGGPTVRP